jgi:hypothetical protein
MEFVKRSDILIEEAKKLITDIVKHEKEVILLEENDNEDDDYFGGYSGDLYSMPEISVSDNYGTQYYYLTKLESINDKIVLIGVSGDDYNENEFSYNDLYWSQIAYLADTLCERYKSLLREMKIDDVIKID